jgi:hypothetical protein
MLKLVSVLMSGMKQGFCGRRPPCAYAEASAQA